MKKKLGCGFLLLIFILCAGTNRAQTTWTKQTYNADIAQIENNPLKGLMPGYNYYANSFPYSMEHFYLGLNSVMKDLNNFDWSEFESELNRISKKGCHAVPRFFIDYPGRPSALPAFLQNKVSSNNYTDYDNKIDQSKSPDWNSEALIASLENFIAAFGAKYDGDIRLAAVEIGLYGFWGEWHNYPHDSWDMSAANKDRVIASFVSAFSKTQLCLREPGNTGNLTLRNSVGYHDDSFCQSTIGDQTWYFWPKMVANGAEYNYQHHPTGGEIYPELQKNGLWDKWPNTVGQDISSCITNTHASWLIAHELYGNAITSDKKKNALKMHKMLGYQFYVDSVKIKPTEDGKIVVDTKLLNNGVAPFYYNWVVEFAAINSKGKWVGIIGNSDWQINNIMPTSKDYARTFTSTTNLPVDTYKILMRFVNPLEAQFNNAKSLRFANEKQDEDKNGWLTLGIVKISSDFNDK